MVHRVVESRLRETIVITPAGGRAVQVEHDRVGGRHERTLTLTHLGVSLSRDKHV